ncbi:hypothetical protein SEA_PUPPER_32 [Gordonia phage Pupper]|uniref:Uncharacterized protein n=1 Tax=Gordonia phage Pupper TaxID=2571249 RepID=A0A4Y6ERZ8_9CAUD|nr:hypothetical protein KHQ83_gp032 [Gordonia phage Pupper]QDF18519.1 hypothetical protein SEA_PUPPER_32 [Gordonia phage Pupper]QDF18752.1 hypothetical protein SEA_SCENTAE_32 [Gordonia phage SCentae]
MDEVKRGWHRECGQEVFWRISSNGKFMPPLEQNGEAAVVLFSTHGYSRPSPSGEATVYGLVLVSHYCKPEDVAEQKRRRKATLAQKEKAQRQLRDALVDALPRECPKCHATPDIMCISLRPCDKGKNKANKWPHFERHTNVYLDKYYPEQDD